MFSNHRTTIIELFPFRCARTPLQIRKTLRDVGKYQSIATILQRWTPTDRCWRCRSRSGRSRRGAAPARSPRAAPAPPAWPRAVGSSCYTPTGRPGTLPKGVRRSNTKRGMSGGNSGAGGEQDALRNGLFCLACNYLLDIAFNIFVQLKLHDCFELMQIGGERWVTSWIMA